jgi:RHS repeat-associated protein
LGLLQCQYYWDFTLPDYQIVIVQPPPSTSAQNDTLTKEQFVKYVDSLKVVAKKLDPNKIQTTPTPTSLTSNVYYLTATNRNPDFNSALIGQLKKIIYPTKGSTEFTYEANSYFSNQSEEFNPCAGTYDNIATVYKSIPSQCSIDSTSVIIASGAFSCLRVDYNITIFSQGQDIIDGSISIVNSTGTPVFSKTLRGINSQNPTPKVGYEYVVLAPGTYKLIADLCGENANGSNTSSASLTLQGIAVTPANYVTRTSGGLRIKEVKDCPNSIASQCLTKEYAYTFVNDPNNSSGRIVTNGKYYYPINYFTTTDILTSALYLNSASQLPLSTTLGHYVGYKTVIMKEVALNALSQKVYKGKTVFEYKSPDELDSPDLNSTTFPFTTISYDWKRGVVTQSKVFDQTGDWLKDNQSTYSLKSSLDYSKILGLKTGKAIHNTEASPLGFTDDIYIYNKYASETGFQFNSQSINKEQFKVGTNLSSIESTTNNIYGNDIHLQPTQTSTLSSKGETLVMQYQYPHDIFSGDLATSALALRTAGRRAELLQTETFRNGVSIGKSQNFYDTFGTNILPSKQRTFIGGSTTVATESQQLSYDSYGNLTSYKDLNGGDGITNSLMWGYKGQYPVVSIINGVPANLSALLNETSESVITSTASSLRTTLPNAHISHYAYQPMIGLLAQTNPAQLKTSFTYDGLNRLSKVFDNSGYILKAYDYQIATTVGGNNYVKEMMPRTGSATLLTGYQNVQTTFSYMDGLGRPLQVVAQQAGGDGTNDIVTNATTYDGYARVAKSYIPFPNTGNGALASLPASFDGDTRPYSENILFDNSPLNRLFQVQGVGMAWQTAGKTVDYQYKVAGTEIRNFVIQADGSVDASGSYPAGSLYSTEVISERGFSTFEIKDKEGRTVAKLQQLASGFVYAITSFVYDKNNFLRFVIPPEAYNKFGTGVGQVTSFTENDNLFLEGIYGYVYTNRGLLAEKHIPGAGWKFSVFDKRDNEVLFADESDKAKNFWQFKKYDSFSRIIQSGLINNIGSYTRSQLQADFDNHTGPTFEERGTTLLGYTNVSFPSSYTPQDGNVKFVIYYDDLLWQTESAYNFQFANAYHTQQTNLKGMITGNLVRNLETNEWYKFVNYYDYKGRNIQTFSQNHIGGIDRTDFSYRFNNELLKMRTTHKKMGVADLIEIYDYEYNHVGKKTKFKHSKNGIQKTIASYTYDATGRMTQKKYSPSSAIGSSQTGNWTNTGTWQGGSIPAISDQVTINSGHIVTIPSGQTVTAGTLFDKGILQNFGTLQMGTLAPSSGTGTLQTVDYQYHIRGNSLRGINLDAAGNLTNKIFSLKLGYEDAGFYDGNIGKQEWKSSLDNVTRSFTYSYDGASRITGGSYVGTGSENYSLNSVSYDLNGNIKTLSRSGYKSNNTFGVVDNLNYTYNPNSNKILKVDDISNETASFTDVTGNDYTYWEDGSLKSDANKGISLIEYNYLKLPKRIVKGGVNILYQYDASGKKLKETTGSQVTDYVGNKIYKNNVLYQLGHDEGRIVNEIYEYQIKDHLGNLRVAFKDSLGIAKIVQANSYGIWGEDLTTLSYKNTPNLENHRFTGKENLPETGYTDFGARLYDNLVPRFIMIDPLAEKTANVSPLAYSNNNPINMIDIDGRYAVSVHYDITYEALKSLGYSDSKADLIAHMSSTYADHPTEGVRFADHFAHNRGARSGLERRKEINYNPTADSQEEYNSKWHSMMSDDEAMGGMSRNQAMFRGLKFGWDNIFAQEGNEDLGKLGQGLHALQDAYAHQGMRTATHLDFTKISAWKQTFVTDMYGNTKEASLITRSAIVVLEILKGNKPTIKDGDTLNFTGMSSNQFDKIIQRLLKQGFTGTIRNH